MGRACKTRLSGHRIDYCKVDVARRFDTMVTRGGDFQPGCSADRLLTGLGQPQINLEG